MQILLDELSKTKNELLEIRLVGAPNSYGKEMALKYSRVTYLGELSDKDLEMEVATWSLFLNPVWWYSTGASTKLAKAISWGIPIVSTNAGMRGYKWFEGNLMIADTSEQMSKLIFEQAFNLHLVQANIKQTKTVANNSYSVSDLSKMVEELIS